MNSGGAGTRALLLLGLLSGERGRLWGEEEPNPARFPVSGELSAFVGLSAAPEAGLLSRWLQPLGDRLPSREAVKHWRSDCGRI